MTGFEDAFSVFDANGNGKIKVREVFPLIRSLGHNPIEAAVWCYLNELDLAGQLEQFIYGRPFPCDLWVLIPLQRCFSLFDSNGLLELVFDCFIFVE